ncbi:forkhead box protein R1 [Bufo bufo]|uniref:forkhead box protein R1 n=1 Tax=Bufo bufo TaxID=8384 RepID=UPI001ABE1EAA|nr:forkhead box protein R1 [Bufo bufo]
MYLRFSDRTKCKKLHLSTALEDWDMAAEMKQCTTIDQYFFGAEEKVDRYSLKRQASMETSPCRSEEGSPQESTFHPTLWLVVDPNVVIPCPEVSSPPEPCITPSCKSFKPNVKTRPSVDCTTMDDSDDDALTSSSELCTEDDHCYTPSPSAHLRRMSTQVKYRKGQIQKTAYETWPRPPINYCNLISLALRNSEDGSLNVQQIYSFVREHFPFFRVAPDGWKNTVRHNLCFSSSFEKSAGWVCADGHRRSCLWKLTRQGRRKFRAEMHSLSDELLHVLRRSMNKPALMELMFGM